MKNTCFGYSVYSICSVPCLVVAHLILFVCSSSLLTISPCSKFEGCCYSILLKNSHPCVERAMHHDCPICFEVSFCHSWCNSSMQTGGGYSLLFFSVHHQQDTSFCSIFSNQQMMLLFCPVATLFTLIV